MKFYFKANRKFLELIRTKNVYCPINCGIVCVKNNEKIKIQNEYQNDILNILISRRTDLNYYIICDTEDEYIEYQTKYTLFLLQQ